MTDNSLKTGHCSPDDSGFRLVLVSLAAALATFVIAVAHHSARGTVDESMSLSFGASYAWVGSQSFLLNVPGLMIGFAIARYLPRIGSLLGSLLMFSVPILFFCDVTTFRWIGERFLSGTMHTIATSLAPALMHHVTRSSLIDAGLAVLVAAVAIHCTWSITGWASRRWATSRDPAPPFSSALVLVITAFVMATPALWDRTRTLTDMSRNSTRHPFCAFHLVGYRGVGVPVPQGEKAILARLRGLQVAPQVQAIDKQHDALALDRDSLPGSVHARQLQDVIIVVIESMRPELVSPEIMPNLHAFSQRSIRCNRHFSEGNSTTYGFFGLVNGIEAVWFDRPVWKRPILNRVLHQACYELGFFGGEDDWPEFGMDGFIGGAQFDYFMIEYPKPLETDYRAVQRAQLHQRR